MALLAAAGGMGIVFGPVIGGFIGDLAGVERGFEAGEVKSGAFCSRSMTNRDRFSIGRVWLKQDDGHRNGGHIPYRDDTCQQLDREHTCTQQRMINA